MACAVDLINWMNFESANGTLLFTQVWIWIFQEKLKLWVSIQFSTKKKVTQNFNISHTLGQKNYEIMSVKSYSLRAF